MDLLKTDCHVVGGNFGKRVSELGNVLLVELSLLSRVKIRLDCNDTAKI